LELAINDPGGERKGIALIAHPHSLEGGTLDNKVVTTLAKTFFGLGYYCVRPNFRGVGASEGSYEAGIGETDDLLAVAKFARDTAGELPFVLCGFSFGGFVQTRVCARLSPRKLVLVAPAVGRFPVGDVPSDTLVIHGEEDDVVPLADLLNWARPREIPIVVVPGVGHFFHHKLHVLSAIVLSYFR
jgi:alpha/beta superfamily hydrolase